MQLAKGWYIISIQIFIHEVNFDAQLQKKLFSKRKNAEHNKK